MLSISMGLKVVHKIEEITQNQTTSCYQIKGSLYRPQTLSGKARIHSVCKTYGSFGWSVSWKAKHSQSIGAVAVKAHFKSPQCNS